MFRKITALAATATLATGALLGVSAPAHAAAHTIYTQCTADGMGHKLTPKNLPTTKFIDCNNLADVSPLKAAKNLQSLGLGGDKALNIKGTATLRNLGITSLHVWTDVSDPTFSFVKDFPRLTVLGTGVTKVSSLENIAKLRNLEQLSMTTHKPYNLKKLASYKKLRDLALHAGSSKVDLESLAALPNLQILTLHNDYVPSLKPLQKSTSLKYIDVSMQKMTKLKKGQTYTIPAETLKKYGRPSHVSEIGWKLGTKNVSSVKSNGPGFASLYTVKDSKLGKISVTNDIFLIFHTPGKIDFTPPTVAAKSVHKGQTIRATLASTKQSNGWNHVISKCSYQWQGNTKDIKGATKLTYKTTRADAGKTLRLRSTCHPVTEAKKFYGFATNTKYSGAVKVGK